MRRVGALVQAALPAAPVVVLSATAGTTNSLLTAAEAAERGDVAGALLDVRALGERHRTLAHDLLGPSSTLDADIDGFVHEIEMLVRGIGLLRELSPRSRDAVASFGERLSTLLLTAHLREEGILTTHVDARSVLRTDDGFGAARPDREAVEGLCAERLRPHVGAQRAVVTEGFVGATEQGVTTTLGRGGSDYTAALLGEALGAAEVQIWTDVEGVYTADPRIVPDARPIPELSFAEAAELAAFGAKVLHPATIQPAVAAGIPVTVRDTMRPEGRYTSIQAEVSTGRSVTAIASRTGITVITVTSSRMLMQSGFLERLFEVFGRHAVNVDLVATAEVSVSLTVDGSVPLKAVLAELAEFSRVSVAEQRAVVAVIGERLKATPGIARRVFGALAELNVEMISMGANEINLSLVIAAADVPKAVRALHAALFG
ncbi:MAG: lysine-sensitive aspartokinase 3 [Gemmatimonadetes bacterium]|nr:lysine-sensitive aspartokinase 3 [Gemmatimonadota bacterium]